MSISPNAFPVFTYRELGQPVLAIGIAQGSETPNSKSAAIMRRHVARRLGVSPRHFERHTRYLFRLPLSIAIHLTAEDAVDKATTAISEVAGRMQPVSRRRRRQEKRGKPANRRHVLRAAGAF